MSNEDIGSPVQAGHEESLSHLSRSEDGGAGSEHHSGSEVGAGDSNEAPDYDKTDNKTNIDPFDLSGEVEWKRIVESERTTSFEGGTRLVETLLDELNNCLVSTELLKAAAEHPLGLSYALEKLIRHNGNVPIHQDIVKAAASNWNGHDMMEVLLDHDKDLEITEELIIAAVGSRCRYDIEWTPVLELLLSRRPLVGITEQVMKTAANNFESGDRFTAALLRHRRDILITEDILLAAVANQACGEKIVQMLVEYSNIDVTDKMILAVIHREENWGVGKSVEMMQVLLSSRMDPEISGEIMEDALANSEVKPGLLEALQKFTGSAAFSKHKIFDATIEEVMSGSTCPNTWFRLIDSTPVCETCSNLDFRRERYLENPIRMADLVRTSEAGCQSCALIRNCINALTKDVQLEHYPHIILRMHYKSDISSLYVSPSYDKKTLPASQFSGIEIYRHEDSPVFSEEIGIGYDILENASNDKCMDLATHWLQDCIHHHDKCPSTPTLLPTRVIKVGSNHDEPLLHISAGESARYVALTHCWGRAETITTTIATLEVRKRAIPLVSLPQTFQDAIIITRRLGIEYLWIDSLCIIQDSAEDWSREAAKMTDVYLNATVTIAADGALNEEGGCFAPFDSACQTRNTSISIPCLNNDGTECRVYCRLPMQPNNLRGDITETAHCIPYDTSRKPTRSELSSRGWTFQERLLSPRILHFSPVEMAWECATQLCCECIPIPRINPYNAYKSRFFGQETSILQLKQITDRSSYPRATQWGKMVEEFTSRKLSYASDRLPAISGLAGLIQADSDDEYVCGLWRRTLARELLWAVETASTLFSYGEYQLSHRHEYYYAPSWTWAAVTSQSVL